MTEAYHTPASRPLPWCEVYQGGSPEAEQEHFRQLASAIVDGQRENQQNSGGPPLRRTFHANIVVGVGNAELAFADALPSELSACTSRPAPGSRSRSGCPAPAAPSAPTAPPTCGAPP